MYYYLFLLYIYIPLYQQHHHNIIQYFTIYVLSTILYTAIVKDRRRASGVAYQLQILKIKEKPKGFYLRYIYSIYNV